MDDLRPIPRQVTVLGHVFPVVLLDIPDGGHGCLYLDPHRIELSSNDTLDIQWATLAHEILHAGVRLGGLQSILEVTGIPGLEEAIVSNLERTLMSTTFLPGRAAKNSQPLLNFRR